MQGTISNILYVFNTYKEKNLKTYVYNWITLLYT